MCYLVAKDRDAHGYVKGATAMKILNIPVGVSDFKWRVQSTRERRGQVPGR